MCDLCFIPKCNCDAVLADSQVSDPDGASGVAVRAAPPPTLADALALDSSQHWTQDTIRYGFPDTADGFTGGLSYYSPYDEPGSRLTLSEFGRDSLRDGFAEWDAVTALGIVEAPAGTMAEINVGASGLPSTAWAYYPGGQAANGDIWFNTGQWFLDALAGGSGPIIGSYAHATGMHEFGHALGLKHPHQVSGGGTAVLDPAYDAVEFSIMSYRSYPGGAVGAYTIESWGYPQTPMMLDIAMIQEIYGADYTTLAGDTTYTVSTATGEMFVDGMSQGTPGGNRVFRTLWDGDGTDHIDLAQYTTSMHADLTPGRGIRFDTDGNFQAARLASGTHAGFNIYMSLLHDGDTRSLIENLTTGSGDDVLIGNAAANVLASADGANSFTGGAGADRLVLGAGADTVIDRLAGLDGDTVMGFDAAQDRVQVRDAQPDTLTATLSAGLLTLTMGATVARVAFDGLDPAFDTVSVTPDGPDLVLAFSASGNPDTPDTPDTSTTPESLLAEAVAAYTAAGRAVIEAVAGDDEVKSPGGGAVLIGDDGFTRLREGTGDDVMYGGAGPDHFVWNVARADAERDTVLDLDFAGGDVLRLSQAAGSIWIKSDADLSAAIDSGLLTARSNGAGGTELALAAAPGRVLDLAFHVHPDSGPAAPDTPDISTTPESLLAEAVAAYTAAGRAVIEAVAGDDEVKSPGGGAVLIGDDGFTRLREGTGDDVMYGGAGPDHFVWNVARADAERDTVLDLDFAGGDVLRLSQAAGSIWIKSDADLSAAIDSGLLTARSNGAGGTELALAAAPGRVLDLAFH
ncbi:M10 family metallopeptidase, partial [Meridianimarinicoccus sp. RP-17]